MREPSSTKRLKAHAPRVVRRPFVVRFRQIAYSPRWQARAAAMRIRFLSDVLPSPSCCANKTTCGISMRTNKCIKTRSSLGIPPPAEVLSSSYAHACWRTANFTPVHAPALLTGVRRCDENPYPRPSCAIPENASGRSPPPRQARYSTGRQGRTRMGLHRERPCGLSPLILFFTSASVASDIWEGA
jgi:hypothetical protein